MKRLNNKGYMIVEIIVSATIAMTIAYFMMDLIVKLKEKYDYVQNDTILMTDKTVITNEILGDLYSAERDIVCALGVDTESDEDENINYIIFKSSKGPWLRLRYEKVEKEEEVIEHWIKYEESPDKDFDDVDNADTIFYQKKFNELLNVSEPKVDFSDNIASFIINAETLTSKKNYGINIIFPVNECNPEMQ